MKQFKKLAKMIQLEKDNQVAQTFVNDLNYTIECENSKDFIPTRSYKPSGIGGCKRSLYYQLIGATPDKKPQSVNLVGICESGTSRHEIIQDYIMKMNENGVDCEWIDVGFYLKAMQVKDPKVIHKVGNETKLFSEKYNMRFMCDGLVCYKGEYYIIEIKTESSRKFSSHDSPYLSHKLQATCYAMTIGVPRVIFIYENRDTCEKKGYLVEVTKENIEDIEKIINEVNEAIDSLLPPPREFDKCMYCNYKEECKLDE